MKNFKLSLLFFLLLFIAWCWNNWKWLDNNHSDEKNLLTDIKNDLIEDKIEYNKNIEDIYWYIYSIDNEQILIVEDYYWDINDYNIENIRWNAIYFKINNNTIIKDENWEAKNIEDLQLNRLIKAWATWAIQESYPSQTEAYKLIIELEENIKENNNNIINEQNIETFIEWINFQESYFEEVHIEEWETLNFQFDWSSELEDILKYLLNEN